MNLKPVVVVALAVSLLALPARAANHLDYNGGAVLHHPKVFAIYWDDQWNLDHPAELNVGGLNSSMSALLNGDYLQLASEYDDGTGSVGRGSFVGSTTPKPYTCVPMKGPTNVTDADITGYLTCMIFGFAVTGVAPQDPDTVYVIFTPYGTNVENAGGEKSCASPGFLGYHGAHPFPYIVMPAECFKATATDDVTSDLDRLIQTFSHELVEAASDPYPHSGYYDNSLDKEGETADICKQPNDFVWYEGQFLAPYWSNNRNACVVGSGVVRQLKIMETGIPNGFAVPMDFDSFQVAFNRGSLTDTLSLQVVDGTVHTYDALQTVQIGSTRYQTTAAAATGSVTMNGDQTVVIPYSPYYWVETSTLPPVPNPGLTPSDWYPQGALTLSTPSTLTLADGSLLTFRRWHTSGNYTNLSPSFTVNVFGPYTAVAEYGGAFTFSFGQTGIPAGVPWAVEVNGASLPGPAKYVAGENTMVSFAYPSPVADPSSGARRYALTSVNLPSPAAAVINTTVTATYQEQDEVRFIIVGLDKLAATLTNSGTPLASISELGSVWLAAGSPLSLASDALVSSTSGAQYYLQGINPPPPATVTGGLTLTVGYAGMAEVIDANVATSSSSSPPVAAQLKLAWAKVEASLGARDYSSALGQCDAFDNQVQAHARSGRVGAAQASRLRLDAMLTYHAAICAGLAAGTLDAGLGRVSLARYATEVTALGDTPIPGC